MKLAVCTISDRASRGEYEDLSGPELVRLLAEAYPDAAIETSVVPDDPAAIRAALERLAGADWIITTGGTGIGPRDITPEVTAGWCQRGLPGIAEAIRAESWKETPHALLSRAYAGQRGSTIVVNLPGSVKAVHLGARVLIPVMEHAVQMIRGEGH